MRQRLLWFSMILGLLLGLAACSVPVVQPTVESKTIFTPIVITSTPKEPTSGVPVLALIHGRLIDGTGSEPVNDGVVLIQGGKIIGAGQFTDVNLPPGAKIIDLGGATILPGFINVHVHDAFNADSLKKWAYEGVTTVRDEGVWSGTIKDFIQKRDSELNQPDMARLVSAGHMMTVPGGYGYLFINSVDDAALKVNAEIDGGADMIKVTMEDGYAGQSGLPKFNMQELKMAVDTAHQRGKKVSAHITQGQYMAMVVDAGVDDVAHTPYDQVPAGVFQKMIDHDIYLNSTLTVLDAYGAIDGAKRNLATFVQMGGKVAMGNDYTKIPQNGFDHFDLGMPMYELNLMSEAGMTPMQIIVASTRNAAHVVGLDKTLGTLESGKVADLLVVRGDPLSDIKALRDVKLVMHGGVIIHQE